MSEPQVKIVYQVVEGDYPFTTVVHEATSRPAARDWIISNKSKGRVLPVHVAWVQGAWRKINSQVINTDPSHFANFEPGTLRAPSGDNTKDSKNLSEQKPPFSLHKHQADLLEKMRKYPNVMFPL